MSAPPAAPVETALPPPQPPVVAEPAPTPAQPRPPAKPRLLYIDNLRSVLISMVVLLHLAITYGAEGDWWYNEAVPESMISDVALTFYTTFAQAFTLAFFFMISGYFCPPAYDKKGPRPYTVDKLKRLGVPFLFYFAVLNPLLVMMVHLFEGQPAIPPGVSPLAFWVDSFGPGLMWFAEALLIFSLAYMLWRMATAGRSQAASSASRAERGAPRNGPPATGSWPCSRSAWGWSPSSCASSSRSATGWSRSTSSSRSSRNISPISWRGCWPTGGAGSRASGSARRSCGGGSWPR